jgi:folate-binding protein YgfZ
MGEDNLVAEVGLDLSATSFNKGCYLGQETTARVQSRGHVNRKLVRLRWQGQLPKCPAELFQGEKKVGTLSSAAESPKAGSVGLGTVALAAWEKPEEIFFKDGDKEIAIERWT